MLSRLRGTTTPAPEPDEAANLKELRALQSPQSPTEAAYLTDSTLQRYLRARNQSVPRAHDMLQATLQWRRVYGTDDATAHLPSLRREAASGKLFVLPAPDAHGNAVIVMRPGLENSSDAAENVRHLVYTLERASRLAPTARFTVIVDYFTGKFSVTNAPGLAVMREVVAILQNHYPERLGAALLYDAPRFFLGLYRLLRPFVDTATREKIHFVRRVDATTDAVCGRVLDRAATPVEYGGSLAYVFDADAYFAADDTLATGHPPVASE